MSGGLNGSGFVAVDVSRGGGDNALPGPQKGGNGGKVGLGPADHKLDVGLRSLTHGADQIGGLLTVTVSAIADNALGIDGCQGL